MFRHSPWRRPHCKRDGHKPSKLNQWGLITRGETVIGILFWIYIKAEQIVQIDIQNCQIHTCHKIPINNKQYLWIQSQVMVLRLYPTKIRYPYIRTTRSTHLHRIRLEFEISWILRQTPENDRSVQQQEHCHHKNDVNNAKKYLIKRSFQTFRPKYINRLKY